MWDSLSSLASSSSGAWLGSSLVDEMSAFLVKGCGVYSFIRYDHLNQTIEGTYYHPTAGFFLFHQANSLMPELSLMVTDVSGEETSK
ncbi:hypothetical protein OPV22_007020 [Ensete ventricosum]|uniref:Uncharacterized protein n=1 Tax=Ensete ventricosum TaxID=4639 RepID=A0AAV8RTI3_ENSVE|nr:hypothetical protein OPV22_007020 [Ensete ventricosum]